MHRLHYQIADTTERRPMREGALRHYKHSGNAAFLEIIGTYKAQYVSAANHAIKDQLAEDIVKQIWAAEGGGGSVRFLQLQDDSDGNVFRIITDKWTVLEKVKMALRQKPRLGKKAVEQAAASSASSSSSSPDVSDASATTMTISSSSLAEEQNGASNTIHSWIPTTTASINSTIDGSANGIFVGQHAIQEDAYSVPAFTNEEERWEKQQMSPSEIRDIESDLRGITAGMDAMSMTVAAGRESSGVGRSEIQNQLSSWRNDDEMQSDLKLLHKEIQRIPADDKTSYLTAILRCPDEAFAGWRWESFLEQTDFDAKLTAKNLAEYWKRRLALFGEDRCFLPMTLAGAMQDEVAGMITYGTGRISPVKDCAVRTVVVMNMSPSRRVRSLYSTNSQCKAFWYNMECVARDPEARRCGIVVLFNGKGVNPTHFDPRFVKFAVRSSELFPVSWKALHFSTPVPWGRLSHHSSCTKISHATTAKTPICSSYRYR